MRRQSYDVLIAAVLSLALLTGGCGNQEASTPTSVTGAPQAPAAAGPADWCGGHKIPESMCTLCNPGLVERFQKAGDWCEEHGFPESACPVCNPMDPPTKGAARPAEPVDWCGGHKIPESMCTLCNPGLVERFQKAGDWCDEHGFPESACPVCNPMDPPTKGAASEVATAKSVTRIRFRTPALEQVAGIETSPAAAIAMGLGLETTARIDFNRNAMADVRSPVPGIVRDVRVDLGQEVGIGERLFTLESAHVGDLQARRRGARERVESTRANLARQTKLRQRSINSQRSVELARQELEVAEAELQSLDQSLRISGASRSAGTGRFAIHAPSAGAIVRRPALVGTYAGESISLATIANTEIMWALLDVPEGDAQSLELGQDVEVEVDGIASRNFTGRLTWIASEVDSRTRTVTARSEVENQGGLLRAGQFARATVRVEAPLEAVTVPLSALQRVGDESVVFIRVEEGLYDARVVRPGRSDGRRVQIEGDVSAGDAVVTTGAFLLRTEMSRESIGAGCCEVEGPGER